MSNKIIKKREDDRGRNYKFQLNTGEVIGLGEAKEMIDSGKLPDYNYVPPSKHQRSYIRANPNDIKKDNIEEQGNF